MGNFAYFEVLRDNQGEEEAINVVQEAFDLTDVINEAEQDLKMDEVNTIITTVVSIGRPNHAQQMLSEKMLLFSEQLKYSDLRHNDKLRQEFFRQKNLVCLGKLVPNMIRD